MRKLLTLMALGAAVLLAEGASPHVPRKAPEFAIQMPDGSQQLLSKYRGKPVAMAFMFTTCPHCQHTAGVLAQVQKEYAAKGVQVLGVTFDNGAQGRVKQFIKDTGANFPIGIAQQGQVLEFLQIPINEPYFVPVLVFIDPAGSIRSEYIGDEAFLAKQEINIRAELEKIIKTAPPAAAKAKQ